MRKLLAVIGLAFGSIFLGHTIAQACGDKLLALGRGVSFQRAYRAARPASILLYLGQNSKSGPIGDPRLQATLKSAGHTLRVAADAGQLDQLLKFGRFDVVLADLSEVGALSQ